MKKITREAVKEVAEYRSDFSGEKFPLGIPPVQVSFDFGYGSRHDGTKLELHLSDDETGGLLDFVSKRLCKAARAQLGGKLRAAEGDIDASVEVRDWESAEMLYSGADLYRRLLGADQDESRARKVRKGQAGLRRETGGREART